MRARDERDLYFKEHPTDTDRHYLLAVFDDLAKLPGAKDIFGSHNALSAYRDWLSGDAAQKLIEFFQKIDKDETGELIHDFTDPVTPTGGWDTRFLGDLYQDLSEAARKKYALLQTPVFIEEFILERTLEPAIKEFGIEGFKMIDPACGSGHFLLGAFARILGRWRRKEPATTDRELINRTLAATYGIDLNPYAIAITRFRLLLAAMRECQTTHLKDAPTLRLNLACGDSLLHGAPGKEQQMLGYHELAHVYESEDLSMLRRILSPGAYNAVVANPPYITVKDKALNQAYRERYPEVCHMKYSLAVPFMQRLFILACENGFVGQITANNFMKREFGKKLIESYIPTIDLGYLIDTSGAYIPGHGTPTVILLGRNRAPVARTVRAVMGIRGEPATPEDPSRGQVWTAITQQIDQVGSQSQFISVSDIPREQLGKHPWSIGGGGSAELKERLDQSEQCLKDVVQLIGVLGMTNADDVMLNPPDALRRHRVERDMFRSLVLGDEVRDWRELDSEAAIVPYDKQFLVPIDSRVGLHRFLWPSRTVMGSRATFAKNTYFEEGRPWWEWHQIVLGRLRTPLTIVYGEVATHNHFVLDRGGKVFKQTAPVIKLPATATEDDHVGLLGLLNSSTACFWLKQGAHNKGDSTDQHGARTTGDGAFNTFAFNATLVGKLPIPEQRPVDLSQELDNLAAKLTRLRPSSQLAIGPLTQDSLSAARVEYDSTLAHMIALQEELDWQVYQIFDLIDEDLCYRGTPPPVQRGQRPFEIVLARCVQDGVRVTDWFRRHGISPITDVPHDLPEDYRQLVQRRIKLIESDRNIGLIEQPEYKRRWNIEAWEKQQERAVRDWLLCRLESYFDSDGRMNEEKQITAHTTLREPRLTSIALVADLARKDAQFIQVAELYVGRMDFDITGLIDELITAESVPALPVLRYKPNGLHKRAVWERTWGLQRLEDAVDALFEADRLKELDERAKEDSDNATKAAATLSVDASKQSKVARELGTAASYFAEATKQGLDLDAETVTKPIRDAAKRAKKTAVGQIPVPLKYNNADFLNSKFWRLRGKLDVPKERWVSFPHCEGEDGTLVIAWAGYDHLQLARAIAERYELAKEQEGRKLVPLLAAIGQLIPWLKQWHNELDPAYGTRMGDYYENYLAEEAKAIGKSVEEVMAWTPPAKVKKTRKKRTKTAAKP